MNINQLKTKYKNALPDSTLEEDLVLIAMVKSVPGRQFAGEYTILVDDTGELEAIAISEDLFSRLSRKIGVNLPIKLKGRLSKTEFENIAFAIEEILE